VAELSPAEQTWRYLRLAMIALVIGLGVALVYERSGQDCFQTSISAYYYTPVHGFFIGALVAIGVCLYCLKSHPGAEDILLNLAGMCAPIVALVPISKPGECHAILDTTDRDLNIANNLRALLALELLALAFIAFSKRREPTTRAQVVGFGGATSLWVLTTVVYFADRDLFLGWGHFTAAGLMFALIIIVVCINAFTYKDQTNATTVGNRYAAIAGAMVGSLVLIPIGLTQHWPYWVIVLETILILLFAVFWGLQTWDESRRASARSR
jgi:hypothetical protein